MRRCPPEICVVALSSLPVSAEFAPCRSGTGEEQGRCGEPALTLGFYAIADRSVSFRLLSATEFGTRGSEVKSSLPDQLFWGASGLSPHFLTTLTGGRPRGVWWAK
jgi:hypothetical protein